jgi:hypothetical protein
VRQFNTPPGWPDAPNARWRPPKRWGPAEAWPPAPDGWRFWVDEDGRPVRGPIGRYGGPSIVKLGSVTAVVLALIGLVLFNPFTGDGDPETTAAPMSTPTEGTTSAPGTEGPTSAGASTTPTIEPTTQATIEPTPTPTPEPTQPKTSEPSKTTPTPTEPSSAPTTTSTAVVYKNCAEVRAAGKAPLRRGDPGYSAELDNNGDGTACERGNS